MIWYIFRGPYPAVETIPEATTHPVTCVIHYWAALNLFILITHIIISYNPVFLCWLIFKSPISPPRTSHSQLKSKRRDPQRAKAFKRLKFQRIWRLSKDSKKEDDSIDAKIENTLLRITYWVEASSRKLWLVRYIQYRRAIYASIVSR